ncbi:MAG TPA: RNA polymerase sigma factor [Anaeromyxobacteraceae bacterium]|nr:RNA polymerase sigma factor [Anaeromyxobacteraceae bacterium]
MTSLEIRALYERFGFSVYRRCLRVLRDPALAEDALQDVFVRVLRLGDGFRGGSRLAWLLRIADRAALDRIDRDGVLAPWRPEMEEAPDVASPLLQAPEASRLLSEVLAALPARLQEVALLSSLDGMSQAEMAAALGCSTMTVKRRVRALHERARELTAHPGQEVDHAEDLA